MQKKYTYIHTPGHGYLSVSIKEIKRLNLVDVISEFSYINMSRVFLEEDCDLGLFVEAKKNLSQKIDIKESHRDVEDIVAGSRYNPIYIKYPIQVGRIVSNGVDKYTVVSINKKQIVIENECGRFGVPISNPYRYIRPLK